jgi:pimeloyl-ACP methyl ester carboxylesterase
MLSADVPTPQIGGSALNRWRAAPERRSSSARTTPVSTVGQPRWRRAGAHDEDVDVQLPSSDGVEVVVHDLGGDGPPLLLSHATGFHGRTYRPMATAVADRFHGWALDYRGHGETVWASDGAGPLDWRGFGDDALVAARGVAPGGGLVAFGHSMGGAALLMAAHRDPAAFSLIIAFEPVLFPPLDDVGVRVESPLVAGARRRRRAFPSYAAAIEHYASKPPMMAFHPDALREYVLHGFAPAAEGVTLRCDPEHEARTFETGAFHTTWELLGDIHTPVVVMAGHVEEMSPSSVSARIADALPRARYVELAHLDHFGPMTHPEELAELVAELAADVAADRPADVAADVAADRPADGT